MSKRRKVGRPKMEKGHAKAHLISLRLKGEEYKRITSTAKAQDKTVSEWIRSTLHAATQG